MNKKKFSWDISHGGPVGRLKTKGLENVLSEMKNHLDFTDQKELIISF